MKNKLEYALNNQLAQKANDIAAGKYSSVEEADLDYAKNHVEEMKSGEINILTQEDIIYPDNSRIYTDIIEFD